MAMEKANLIYLGEWFPKSGFQRSQADKINKSNKLYLKVMAE